MKVELIDKSTRDEAWRDAAQRLIDRTTKAHFVLDIAEPLQGSKGETQLFRKLDAFYRSRRKEKGTPYSVSTVAHTIFPSAHYERDGMDGLEYYAENVYPRIKRDWGTYAFRMLRAEDATGNLIVSTKEPDAGRPFNPLARLIRKVNEGGHENGACFELNIYRPTPGDAGRPLGGPCLSHLSFKLVEGGLHLTALYRHHDYTYKAPGNLLGLAQLLECVAKESGMRPGHLVVHSTLAFIEAKKAVSKILADV